MAIPKRKDGNQFEVYAVGFDRDSRERMGLILELRYGQGLSPTQIIKLYGVPKVTLFRALRMYAPKKGKRDISISIMSAV